MSDLENIAARVLGPRPGLAGLASWLDENDHLEKVAARIINYDPAQPRVPADSPIAGNYSPNQPRVPGGQARGGEFAGASGGKENEVTRVGPAAGGVGDGRQVERFDEVSHVPKDLQAAGDAIKDHPDVLKAVSSYTREKTTDGVPVHLKINGALRSASIVPHEYQSVLNHLDQITKKEFDSPVTVYRGLGDHSESFLDRARSLLESGGVVQDKAFGSATLNPRTATSGFSSLGIVTQVKIRRGAYLEPVTKYEGEHEVLLARNSSFKIVGIDNNVKIGGGRTYTVIRMEEV